MSYAPSRAYAEAASGTRARVTPADAFRRAREVFRAGEKLDVRQLAVDLDVPRGTLYRWIGDRDRLLSDVLWAEAETTNDYVRHHSTKRGLERIIELGGAFIEMIAASPPLHAFIEHEGSRGLALITSPSGGVRPRIVNAVREIIDEEQHVGNYAPPAPSPELADGFVSLVEHYLYADVINGFKPDPAAAKRLGRLLLRE